MDSGARVENLQGDILHYSVRDSAQHHRMIGERYAPLAALQMFEEGRRTTRLRIATAAPLGFIRSFILKGGFRDGKPGLIISLINSYYVMLKFAKLWELQRD